MLALASGDQVIVSIGSSTVRILAKRGIVGWTVPRVIASQRLSVWHSEYHRFNSLHRQLCRAMILDGLLDLLSVCRSPDEIRQVWSGLDNPLAGVAREMFARAIPKPNAQGDRANSAVQQGCQAKPGSRTALDVALGAGGKIIVNFYRELGAHNKCPPTAKTSDDEITGVYSLVGSAFQHAAKQRGEHIPAEFINTIVAGFLQMYERWGDSFMREHLRYEIDKYLREGLREDFRRPLSFFADESEGGAVALAGKAKTLAEQGQPEQAIACFDKALAMDSRMARAWFGKGEVLFGLGREEDAKSCFDKAMKIDPQCVAEWIRECSDKAQRKPHAKL
jgi:tetratricopeptide (TPR) repeat protein